MPHRPPPQNFPTIDADRKAAAPIAHVMSLSSHRPRDAKQLAIAPMPISLSLSPLLLSRLQPQAAADNPQHAHNKQHRTMDRQRGRWEGRVAASAPEGVWDAMIRDGSMLGLDHTTKAPHNAAFRRDPSGTAEQMAAGKQGIDAEDKIAQLQHENLELSADVADLSKAVESLRASLNIVTANLQDSVQSLSTDVQRKADATALKELGSVVATRTDDLLRVVARKANAEDLAQLADAMDAAGRARCRGEF